MIFQAPSEPLPNVRTSAVCLVTWPSVSINIHPWGNISRSFTPNELSHRLNRYGTNKGVRGGLPPLLSFLDSAILLSNQSDIKSPGSMTVYIEPWHQDIIPFLDLKRNRSITPFKATHLGYALWIPDLL